MSETHVVIVGTGAGGRIAADIFTALGNMVLGFLENEADRSIRELSVTSVFARVGEADSEHVLKEPNMGYFVAVDDIEARRKAYETIAEIAKRPCANAVHPQGWVSPYAKLGFGNLVNAQAAVNANAKIGDLNHFHSGVSVEPDAQIGNYCTVNSGARIGANAQIGDNVFVGTGAVIHPGIKVGKGALIGAGSVVLREVEEGAVVHGNPAMPV